MRLVAAGLALAAVASAATASAQASLIDGLGGPAGYGSSCLGPNDDGSSAAVDLTGAFSGGLTFFGPRYTSFYVNTNGNVTFSGPLSDYRSEAFPVSDQPMIAPYWADADIRTAEVCAGAEPAAPETCHEPADNGVWWAVEPGRVVVTWHRVGYYDCHTDKRMSFQLVLTTPPLCAAEDDFDVEFRYAECGWATGDKGGGTGGFGGEEAQAGFDAGNGVDFVEIPGSRESGIHEQLCNESNVGEEGVWRFRIRAGDVVCPDAGQTCDTGLDGICGVGATECVGGTTRCAQVHEPVDEVCNGLDDDCDGAVDESSPCGSGLSCLSGRCSEVCSEFGCPPGFYCDAQSGVCLDDECRDVSCGVGQRCVLGVCAGLCDGITCPLGQQCRVGRCVDPCEGVDCGDCGRCREGRCVDRCEITGCAEGDQCIDGRCVAAACVGVTCDEGTACVGGGCVDRCEGARCPRGELCELGRCVPQPAADPDAGAPEPDAGRPAADAAVAMDAGAGGSSDAGTEPEPDGGCGCRAAGRGPSAPLLALVALGVALRLVRRRARRDLT